jgi:hypothetical protein
VLGRYEGLRRVLVRNVLCRGTATNSLLVGYKQLARGIDRRHLDGPVDQLQLATKDLRLPEGLNCKPAP